MFRVNLFKVSTFLVITVKTASFLTCRRSISRYSFIRRRERMEASGSIKIERPAVGATL